MQTTELPLQELTPRQREVVDTYLSLLQRHARPPCIREMCEALGISSPNGIMSHYHPLVKKGWLHQGEGDEATSRSWMLTEAALRHLLPAGDVTATVSAGTVVLSAAGQETRLSPREAVVLADQLYRCAREIDRRG